MATKPRIALGRFKGPATSWLKGPVYVIAELRYDSRVTYSSKGFFGAADAMDDVTELNKILDQFNVKSITSLFGMSDKQLLQRVDSAPTASRAKVSSEFAKAGFVQIVPRNSEDAEKLVKQLNQVKSIWKAAIAPRVGLASPNFEHAQGYLNPAPNGIDARGAWTSFGARGQGITICDVEANWNFTHEDLPKVRHIGGIPSGGLTERNHGTAVLGVMVSKPGRSGTIGISHKACPWTQSARIDGHLNIARAVSDASAKLKPGDVLLIELQIDGPNGSPPRPVAVQYSDPVFLAIRAAVDGGICVVEPAGNGDEDFQQRIFRGTGLQKDSGAIVVGAGAPPPSPLSPFPVPRSRLPFSNYGRIVNLQAWGTAVTTTGSGDAPGSGNNENRFYTFLFTGTSAAAPLVAASAACIQGHAIARRGRPLAPQTVRSILVRTGLPQQPSPTAPVSQNIGPQPNLVKALAIV